jgi:hypothetical protein
VRWTGDVFGVYPLYDVYDNLPGTCVLRQKLELFLAHGCVTIWYLISGTGATIAAFADDCAEMVELDGIEPTT